MSRLFSSGSRKISTNTSNSRRNIAQKHERKQNSPQPPELHEQSLQEGNVNHSTISENEQESTQEYARESATASPLQTNVIGKESQTHCPEIQGTDKCTSKQNISIQRENKMSNTVLLAKIASNSDMQSPKECTYECTDNQNINTLGVYQSPSNAISANIAASVSDIQRPKELIDECTSKLNISTQRENKMSDAALIAKIASNNGIRSPRDCTEECVQCTDNQNINTLGVYQTPSNAISDNIASSVTDIQRPKELIDECTNRPTLESKRVSKASSKELAANIAVIANDIESPKESITECTNMTTFNTNNASKPANSEFAANIAVAAGDIQSSKESISECTNRPTLESKGVRKASSNALAADIAATAIGIQSPKECIDECASRQSMNAPKVHRNSSRCLTANLGSAYLDIQHPREYTFGFKQPGLTSKTSKVNFEESSLKKHLGSRKMNASIASSVGSFPSSRKSALHAGKLKVPDHDLMQQMYRFEELRRQGKSIAKSLDHQKKLDMALEKMKIDIPRSLELEIHAEASAVVEDLVQAYKKLLGRNHPMTIQAKEHISMISHTGRQRLPRVGILPTMIVEDVDHEKIKIN